MKFIFPQNYNFKNKILGIIDYSTAILNLFWGVFIFFLVNFFPININMKISFFIFLYFPLLLISIIGINGENIIYVFIYILKFIHNRKIYLYQKY